MKRLATLAVLLGIGASAAGLMAEDGLWEDLVYQLPGMTAPTPRTFQKENKSYVTVKPGDTFATLAKELYGDDDPQLVRLLYWANKDKLPDPSNPNSLFKPGERSKVFVVPPRSHVNPVYQLNLKGPEDIGEKEATIIMRGMGLMDEERSFQSAIKGLKYGYTYTSKSAKFNSEVKGYLFREWNLLKKALDRWGAYPDISAEKTPELFEKWLQDSASKLTALPQKQRYALIKSLMTQETGQTHWINFTPIMGSKADTGFGQFIPATAMAVGINPYDPAQNLMGIALHLNGLIRSFGLKEALAQYNGGNDPPARSYTYANSIMARMRRYMK